MEIRDYEDASNDSLVPTYNKVIVKIPPTQCLMRTLDIFRWTDSGIDGIRRPSLVSSGDTLARDAGQPAIFTFKPLCTL